MKFYPQDWRADEKLRLCSLSARGLWLEMLAIMHRSERYGTLLIAGKIPTPAQLAVQVGASADEVSELLEELSAAGVFSITGTGAIYSRRMKRDEKKAKTARENGKFGGNPSLRKQKGNSASVNGQVKGSDKGGLNTQKPEARSQREAKASPAHTRAREAPALPDDLRRVMQAARITHPPSDAKLLREWQARGARLEDHILPVAQTIGDREAERGHAIHKLKYLENAVFEAVEQERLDLEHYAEVNARYGGSAVPQ